MSAEVVVVVDDNPAALILRRSDATAAELTAVIQTHAVELFNVHAKLIDATEGKRAQSVLTTGNAEDRATLAADVAEMRATLMRLEMQRDALADRRRLAKISEAQKAVGPSLAELEKTLKAVIAAQRGLMEAWGNAEGAYRAAQQNRMTVTSAGLKPEPGRPSLAKALAGLDRRLAPGFGVFARTPTEDICQDLGVPHEHA